MVDIINYDAGNATSVKYAFDFLGVPSRLVNDKKELFSASKIILPGAGRASETLKSLENRGFLEVLEELVLKKKIPFLGICVGLQILFDYSEEDETKCLGWLGGEVKRFPEKKIRVPQMGWNEVCFEKSSLLSENIPSESYFYFVNSYYVKPTNADVVLAKTHYAFDFVSMVCHENIVGTQCHLEKSGACGLAFLKNFAELAE